MIREKEKDEEGFLHMPGDETTRRCLTLDSSDFQAPMRYGVARYLVVLAQTARLSSKGMPVNSVLLTALMTELWRRLMFDAIGSIGLWKVRSVLNGFAATLQECSA